ncbi:MAG TPA: 30S ribosomal protein S13 [Candidatus Nanoarchaeia archaeon]|nr:30S ribosomal protein S13 [Candidatus Nanoarchaeia archaeon]
MSEQKPNFKHIVRVANVDVQGSRPIRIALTEIKGIGINLADIVCITAGIDKVEKAGNLNEEQVKKLNQVVENLASHGLPTWLFNRRKDYDTGADIHLLTGNVSFYRENDIKRLKKIKSLKGIRHGKGLPVRGQRTKSHFRTNKGKVVGVAKKKVAPATEGGKKDSGKKDAKK